MDYVSAREDEHLPGIMPRVRILHATLTERQSEHATDEHHHPAFHILLFRHGRNRFSWCGEAVRARPGTLVLAPPYQPHLFSALDPGPATYAEVTFAVDRPDAPKEAVTFAGLLAALTGKRATVNAVSTVGASPRRGVETIFEQLVEALVRNGQSLTAAARMLDLFVAVAGPAPGIDTSIAPIGIARVKAAIEQRFREPLCLKDLAHIAACSQSHLCRRFRVAYGVPPKAYQQKLRIQAARALLTTSNLLCSQIAERLGFGDPYQFSRAFKQAVGVSPQQFRKGQRARVETP